MREIDIEELKKIQIDMLVSIDEFCQKNNINYSLSSGTLIGAVRHQGYIPWDDDIDIMMHRDDYERFVSTFNGTFNHLSLLAPELDLNYYAPYANVYDNRTLLTEDGNGHRGLSIGIKIDIFPIDSVPSDIDDYMRIMGKVNQLNHIMYIKRLENVFKSNQQFKYILTVLILKVLYSCIPYSYLQKKVRDIAISDTYRRGESEYVDNVVYNIYSKKCPRFKRSVLESYIRLPFEGREFSVIKNYDVVLRTMYGDYMQLPPEDKRIPHHNFKAYWLD